MRASGVIYTVKKHGENAGKQKTHGVRNKTCGYRQKTHGVRNKTCGYRQKTHGVRNKAYGLYLPLNFYCKRPPDVQAGVQYP